MSSMNKLDLVRISPEVGDRLLNLLLVHYFPVDRDLMDHNAYDIFSQDRSRKYKRSRSDANDKGLDVDAPASASFILKTVMASLPVNDLERGNMQRQIAHLRKLHQAYASDVSPTYIVPKRVIEFIQALQLFPGWNRRAKRGPLHIGPASPIVTARSLLQKLPVIVLNNLSTISIPFVLSDIGNARSFQIEVLELVQLLASQPPGRQVRNLKISLQQAVGTASWEDPRRCYRLELLGMIGMYVSVTVFGPECRLLSRRDRSLIAAHVKLTNSVFAAYEARHVSVDQVTESCGFNDLPVDVILYSLLDKILPGPQQQTWDSDHSSSKFTQQQSHPLLLVNKRMREIGEEYLAEVRITELPTVCKTGEISQSLNPDATKPSPMKAVTKFRVDMSQVILVCDLLGDQVHLPEEHLGYDCAQCGMPKLERTLSHIFESNVVPRCSDYPTDLNVIECGVIQPRGPFYSAIDPRTSDSHYRDYKLSAADTIVLLRVQFMEASMSNGTGKR